MQHAPSPALKFTGPGQRRSTCKTLTAGSSHFSPPGLQPEEKGSRSRRSLKPYHSYPLVGKKGAPPLFFLRDAFRGSELAEIRQLAYKISPMILASNNIIHLVANGDDPIEPFGSYQISPHDLLLVKREGEKEKVQMILIDQKEAKYFREQIHKQRFADRERVIKGKVAIYTLGLHGLSTDGTTPFDQKEFEGLAFQRAITQLRFLRGDSDFDQQESDLLKLWAESNKHAFLALNSLIRSHDRRQLIHYHGSSLEELVITLTDSGDES